MKAADLTEAQAFLVLNALPNIGPITLNRLLDEVGGDPRDVLAASASVLQSVRRVGPTVIQTLGSWSEQMNLEREEMWLRKTGARFVPNRDPGYPALLREIPDPPIGLYCKGPYVMDRPSVAIVGSRRTTLYGQAVAKKLAGDLARRGFCVVSGLARGIDTAAHEGALEGGGATVGVLGTGMDIVYPPENMDLYRKVAATGAIVTEFPYGRRADRQSFAMRNRIVAGMCEAIVVVESGASGGSMITARFAGEQGRLLFAVPGRIDQSTSDGCHQLIRDGATLLTGVEDILAEFQYLDGMRPNPVGRKADASPSEEEDTLPGLGLSDNEATLLAAFAGGESWSPDALATHLNCRVSDVSAGLMMLEIKRLVGKRPDGSFEARR